MYSYYVTYIIFIQLLNVGIVLSFSKKMFNLIVPICKLLINLLIKYVYLNVCY